MTAAAHRLGDALGVADVADEHLEVALRQAARS